MKSVVALSLATVAVAGCGLLGGVQGSGVSKTEARKVGSFSKIQVQGSGDVTVTVGGPASVEVTSDDNILPLIQTVVQDDTLIIKPTRSMSTHIGINVKVTVPNLTAASINGSGDFDITGIKADAFDVAISGSGDVRADGEAKILDASVAGSGNMDLTKLLAKTAEASISGSGDIRLNVSDSLDASVAGSGDISYIGDPKVSKSISGSGDVSKR